jgi:cell division protein FtsI/penicillin-binding protein 2
VEEPVCVFHYGSLASHILGYVDNDYRGVNGISKSFNEVLKGKDGFRMVERDAMGEIISISETETRQSQPGDDIYLTIDKRYQIIVEEELKSSLKQTKGESATCILMDPNTGEILAMTNIGDYDPNYYWKYGDFERKNRAITDSYEPGSTFKAFTFAALFEEQLCNETEKINTENGVYKYKNNYIRDSHKYDWLNVRGVFEQSSNIGTAKLVQRISDEEYYQYVRSFGFGTYTSITLPGEVTGKLVDISQWKSQTKTYMSFGYNISVTPIQLTSAFSAIVNGGILYQPQIVKKLIDKNGNVVSENSPIVVRRVISEKTSEKMRDIMQGVVDHGTGKQAKIDSIAVGGKTGTSKLVVNGKYSNDQYYSSFVGFYPVEKPKIVCYVLIAKPKGEYYGGLVSAPVFKNIIKRIHSIDEGNIEPELQESDIKITEKTDQLKELNIVPSENLSHVQTRSKENLFAFGSSVNVMPNLSGMTIKEAVLQLNEIGIKWSISGSGVVVNQSIKPGEVINKRKTCVLNCSQINTASTRVY